MRRGGERQGIRRPARAPGATREPSSAGLTPLRGRAWRGARAPARGQRRAGPARAGGGLHPYPRDLHAVVGESVEQQEHLGLRKRIAREAARERRLAPVWGRGGGGGGEGGRWRAPG